MKHFIIYLTVILLVVSCSNTANKKDNLIQNIDKLEKQNIVDNKTVEDKQDKKEIIKPEKFMNFFFNFMWNRDLQKERVKFPITMDSIVISSPNDWIFLPFYSESSYMAQLCQDSTDNFRESILTDTIVLTFVDFKNIRTENFTFIQNDHKWTLTKKFTIPRLSSDNSLFLTFLQKFSSDSVFQKNHIIFPIEIQSLDYSNDYDIISSKINETNWKYINLKDDIDNLLIHDNQRVNNEYKSLQFRGVENGIHSDYIFQKIEDEWFLIKSAQLSM